MFTDEEMEKVYAEKGIDGLADVIQVLLNTLSGMVSAVDIRRANNIWLLFCSRHKELEKGKYLFVFTLCKLNPQYKEKIECLCQKDIRY